MGCDIVVIATGKSIAAATTKTRTPIIESPQQISIVSRDEIEVRASQTVADALSYTAGVQAQPTGVDSRVDEVSVRGFGAGGFSTNNNFLDGLRIASGGEGTWIRPAFDPFSLDRIDVLKGPSGALYGQSAPGGVVNLVTKRPDFAPHGEIQFQGVGFTDLDRRAWQAGADITGPLTADHKLAGRLVGLARYGDTQIRQVKTGRYYIAPSLAWQPDERTRWTLLAQYQRDEGGSSFQFLPALGTLYAVSGRYLDNGAYLGEPDWNRFDRNQYLVASLFERQFGSAMTVRNNTRYAHIGVLYRGVVPAGNTLTTCPAKLAGCTVGHTLNRRAVEGDGETDGIATDTQVEWHVATGAVGHVLLGGVDHFHTEWNNTYNMVRPALVLPLLDIFHPVPRRAAGFANNLTPLIRTETVSLQTGAYLQDQVSAGPLRLTVSGRQDWAEDRSHNPLTGGRLTTRSNAFTWRAGGVWLFDNGLAPYLSYSESFQPMVSNRDPAASQVAGGKPFVPTTGQQYEAGLRFQHGKAIYVTLGAYQITQQNITTPDPTGTLCGLSVCLVQTGEGRIRGAELEGKGSLPWGLTVIATATRSEAKVTRSGITAQVGNHLPQIPDWMASLFAEQRFRSGALTGFAVGAGARHTGRSFGDTANSLRISGYTLFDASLRFDAGAIDPHYDGLSFSINARNLADRRYLASCIAPGCYIGQGRTVAARLQYRW